MVGRDPAPGTIVALYEPPDNLSAPAMRYLERPAEAAVEVQAGVEAAVAAGDGSAGPPQPKT